jgi:hypothetical protein
LFYIGKNQLLVKKLFLLIITLFYLNNCFAQDTIERKSRLTDSVRERFHVLKSAPDTKVGLYQAFFKRKTLIASGNYTNGKRTGLWHFYTPEGRLVENFDFDTQTFTYEGTLDEQSDLGFLFDDKIGKTDTVTRPLKIGGSYYGFIPYLTIFRLPFDVTDTNTDSFEAIVELLISPGGRLADYKVHLISSYYDYNHTFSLDVNLFSEADRIFVPARLNQRPILSRVFIKCYVTSDGRIDYY